MGIRFAPLIIPLHRRLETLAVLFATCVFFLSIALLVYACLNPFLYPLLIAYLIWLYYDDSIMGELF
jgi:2-acylglycerol O-acyltransferase 2